MTKDDNPLPLRYEKSSAITTALPNAAVTSHAVIHLPKYGIAIGTSIQCNVNSSKADGNCWSKYEENESLKLLCMTWFKLWKIQVFQHSFSNISIDITVIING